MQDENELMFGRSDLGGFMAYFGNLGRFRHFFEDGKSGRFTGFFGRRFRETGAYLGLDWRCGRCYGGSLYNVKNQ